LFLMHLCARTNATHRNAKQMKEQSNRTALLSSAWLYHRS
jgi:hypothetical protein